VTLTTSFLGMDLRSPVIVASGPASHDVNQIGLAERHGAGAVVLKTACSDKFRYMRSWPRPRYKLLDWDKHIGGRSRQFSLYSYEQGYSGSLDDYWEFIRVCKRHVSIPIFGSIFADDAGDWSAMAAEVEAAGANAVELDISSPHRPAPEELATTFIAALRAVVARVHIPVVAKLASGMHVIKQAAAVEDAGAHAVTLCNRLQGIDVDIETQRPILHGYYAGIGGPWAKYYTMRHVAEAYRTVHIPISGTGGAITGDDVIKYILVGASTVQVLSAIMINGWETITRMNEQIARYMQSKGIGSLETMRGRAVACLTAPDRIVRWPGESAEGARNRWEEPNP
jgi:dihydroorotate dehydrogenase (fumarate)